MEGEGTGEDGWMVDPLMASAGEGVTGLAGVSADTVPGGGSNINSAGS